MGPAAGALVPAQVPASCARGPSTRLSVMHCDGEGPGGPRVLVVLAEPPLVEGGAAGRTAVGLLRGLRANGVPVTAVAARRSHSLDGEPPADLDVEVVGADHPTGWLTRQRERVARPVGELSRGRFGARVRELARDADVLHLEEVGTAWCDRGTGVPSLVHLHYLVRRDRDLGAPWTAGFREVAETAAAERAALRRHPVIVASSPDNAAELRRRRPSAQVVHVPLSLEPAHYPRAPLDGPAVAGLIGTAGWPPTRDAVDRLLGRIWPAVHAQVPEARLRLAGRGLDPDLPGAARGGVDLLGRVESAEAFLASLSVLLYPVRRGSGMKVKVMEALACGVPVVTTPEGAEGIGSTPGIVVARTDDDLVAAAVRLLRDPHLRRSAGSSARAAFDERFAPAVATAPLVEVYARLARTRR